MEEQRTKARASWVGTGDNVNEQIWFDIRDEYGATEFLGYSTASAEAVVKAIIKDGVCVNEAKPGDTVWIILNQTPFYAESGGQVGDTGELLINTSGTFVVSDTQKIKNQIIGHYGHVKTGRLSVGDAIDAKVDKHRRRAIMRHHSATHLLHKAFYH
jgi:alanyl-tRNA synthetase